MFTTAWAWISLHHMDCFQERLVLMICNLLGDMSPIKTFRGRFSLLLFVPFFFFLLSYDFNYPILMIFWISNSLWLYFLGFSFFFLIYMPIFSSNLFLCKNRSFDPRIWINDDEVTFSLYHFYLFYTLGTICKLGLGGKVLTLIFSRFSILSLVS